MDFFAHGLWTGAIYNRSKHIWQAIFFGVMPDLLSFGIYFVFYAFTRGFVGPDFSRTEPPDPSLIPQYIHGLYNVTHSLIIFLAVFILFSWLAKRFFWEMSAWGIHILIDIPTHTYKFFPTPFLWPVSGFEVNGISWGEPWFMIINYSAIIITYIFIYYRLSRRKREQLVGKIWDGGK